MPYLPDLQTQRASTIVSSGDDNTTNESLIYQEFKRKRGKVYIKKTLIIKNMLFT